MLGSELRESKLDGLFSLVKKYNYCRCVENTKHKLYDSNSGGEGGGAEKEREGENDNYIGIFTWEKECLS